jgi:serine/threonine protein kinase
VPAPQPGKNFGWGPDPAPPFVALVIARGQTIKHLVDQTGGTNLLKPRTVLSIIGPLCHALEVAHERLPHGAVTPRNVYRERNGHITLANLAFGWLVQQALGPAGLGAASDSPFIAPEARLDPSACTTSSDVYSLGLLTIYLLTGKDPAREATQDYVTAYLRQVPENLAKLLGEAAATDPEKRPHSVTLYRQRLADAIETLRDQQLGRPTLEQELQAHPDSVFSPPTKAKMLSADELPPLSEEGDDPALWIVHREGFDYGPYSAEQVQEQFLEDAVDENSDLRNLQTQEFGLLGENSEFADFATDNIPLRQERVEREERAGRCEGQTRGATGFITAGVLALVALYIYYVEFIRPKTEPLPFEVAFAASPTSRRPDRAMSASPPTPRSWRRCSISRKKSRKSPKRGATANKAATPLQRAPTHWAKIPTIPTPTTPSTSRAPEAAVAASPKPTSTIRFPLKPGASSAASAASEP